MFRHLCALLCCLALTGCAAVRGSQAQRPELRPTGLMTMAKAMENYAHPDAANRMSMSRFDYREYVVTLYMRAIDGDYQRFTQQLGAGQRGVGLAFDLAQLGLSGATALAKPSAIDELATIGAVTTGARASVDKHVFFNQTVPALIAIMDADRAEIKAGIARKRGLPVEQYSLGQAFDDLGALSAAGDLDRAVARLTGAAQTQKAQETERLALIKGACDTITVHTGALNLRFRKMVRDDAPASEAARARLAARELGLTFPDDRTILFADVRNAFDEQLCDDNKKAQFLDTLQAAIDAAEGE